MEQLKWLGPSFIWMLSAAGSGELLFNPRIAVAIATVGGMAGTAATALILADGTVQLWTVVIILVTAAIVFLGQYDVVEKFSSAIGIARTLAVVAAAFFVFPNAREFTLGLLPQVPQAVEYQEVLPWLGFMLAGAGGR